MTKTPAYDKLASKILKSQENAGQIPRFEIPVMLSNCVTIHYKKTSKFQ